MPKLSRKAALVKGSLMTFLAPKLAQDARVDLNSFVRGLSNKNYASKREELLNGITNAVKDKLAKDAELDHLPELLEALEREDTTDGEDDADPNAGLPMAGSKSHEFLASKLSADDMATYDAMCRDEVKPGLDPNDREEGQGTGMDDEEEDDEKKAKDDEEEDNEERLKNLEKARAKDRKAMDAKILAAIESEKQRQNAIREAERAFRPHLGELAMSFDSAEEVYRHGLKAMGVRTRLDHVPLTALKAILESQPSPSARRQEPREYAMDANAVESFSKRFKGAVQPKQL